MRIVLWLLAAWLLVTPWFHGALWLSPLYWLLCALWLVAWALRSGHRRVATAAAGGATLALALMTPALANTLLRWVELPLATEACQQEPDRHLVLLTGGTHRPPHDERDIGALTDASVLRAATFADRFRAPDVRPVMVGGGGPGPVPESVLMARLLEQAGMPAQRIRTEQRSTNTLETAQWLRAEVPVTSPRIVLATSALHLPRAAQAFRAVGFDVCECALYSEYVQPGPLATYFPQATALRKSERVLHELVGRLVYRWRA